MATTSDFKNWVDFVELENYEEIYCIYRAVADLDEWGAFKCTEKITSKGSMYFLKCDYCDDILMLASDKAREYFMKYIEDIYVQSELDIEGWYSIKRAMEKND